MFAPRRDHHDLTGRGTILLVEDEDGLRALNARGLASRGYTVLEAGNGVDAIDVLEKADGQVDLVVSDVSCRRWTARPCCANCATATRA